MTANWAVKAVRAVRACVYAILASVFACQLANAQVAGDELFDTYFFSSHGESIPGAQAKIVGTADSVVEVRGDLYRVVRGTVSVEARRNPVSIFAAATKITVPSGSITTVNLDGNAVTVSVNQSTNGEPMVIADGGNHSVALRSGQSYPPNAALLNPVLKSDSGRQPVMIVGRDAALAVTERADTLSMTFGKMFFCVPRDMKIETPMGLITAKSQCQFFLSLEYGSLRIHCCRGNGLKYNYRHKFRTIGINEEFAVFDHRPDKSEVLPTDGIGRKEVTLLDLDGKSVTASKTLFSVVSLLKSPAYLAGWKRRSAIDRKIEGGMLKSAAALAAANPTADSFYQAPVLERLKGLTDR